MMMINQWMFGEYKANVSWLKKVAVMMNQMGLINQFGRAFVTTGLQ